MSCCCFRKKRNPIATEIIEPTKKPLGRSPPPPPNPNTSPDLTLDEILKIQSNLNNINDFNFTVWAEQESIINEVFLKLQGSQFKIPKDPGNSLWSTIFFTAIEIASIATGNVYAEIALTLFLNACSYISENSHALSNYIGINLDDDASDLLGRNLNNYNATNSYFSYLYQDPNSYRDSQYTYNSKTYT